MKRKNLKKSLNNQPHNCEKQQIDDDVGDDYAASADDVVEADAAQKQNF